MGLKDPGDRNKSPNTQEILAMSLQPLVDYDWKGG
jgi:hypothetical protein